MQQQPPSSPGVGLPDVVKDSYLKKASLVDDDVRFLAVDLLCACVRASRRRGPPLFKEVCAKRGGKTTHNIHSNKYKTHTNIN
jgi:hypothetical protein